MIRKVSRRQTLLAGGGPFQAPVERGVESLLRAVDVSDLAVHAQLGGTGIWAGMPELVSVDEPTAPGSPSYSVLTGDYQTQAKWESVPLRPGTPIAAPKPVFTKLDPSVVDEELARLESGA